MKTVNLFGFLFLFGSIAHAQNSVQEDTVRTVTLQEVQVSSKQKNQQQNLYHFFSANKAATTEDILSRLPELSLVRRGSYGMEPVIRSYNSGQINLLLDGMRIHGACTDKMDPASIYIEPVNLNSIEVRTNGSSLINGSSVGGSINMKLAEASCHDETFFSGTAVSGYHTAARAFYQSLNLNYATSKWGLRATGTYRKSNEYKDGSGKLVPFSQYEKVNYSLHGKLLLGDNIYLKMDLLADDGWNIGYPALPMDVGYANARIGSVSLVKENANSSWKKIEAKLYANKVKHWMDDTRRPNVPMHMDMPGESFTTGFYAEGTKSIRKQQLTLRGDVSATSLKASMTMYQDGQPPMYMLTWPDNRQLQSGLAAQYILRLDSLTQIQASARTDIFNFSVISQMGKDQLEVFGYTGNDNQFFIPSVSVQLARKLFGRLKSTLSLGMNGRVPTASEQFGFYLFNQFDGYDYIGNTILKQETAQQAELTFTWHESKWKFQATGYVSKVNNYILGKHTPSLSVMTIGAKGVKQYENIDHALLAGGEGSIVYSPLPQTQIVSTIKYASAHDNEGSPLPMIAPLRNISSVRHQFNKLWLQAETEMAAAQNQVSSIANERSTGAFSLYHFRMGFNAKSRRLGWQLNAGVENVFNTYYREHLDWGNIARPGRNIYVQAGISF